MSELSNNEKLKIEMDRINAEGLKKLHDYRETLSYMMADCPISTLCLPKSTEKVLANNGCLRVYDLFDRDFTKIEGLSVASSRDLTSRFDQFVAMF